MIAQADAVHIPLPDKSIHCCVTSPPYWGLRKYAGNQGDEPLGLEPTPERHVERIVEIFREVRRVLRDDGVVWLNYGDCYGGAPGSKSSNDGVTFAKQASNAGARRAGYGGVQAGSLMMMPHRVALALQADGWIVRQDLVWFKRNPMPESVRGWSFVRHRVRISNHAYLSNLSEGNGDDEDRSFDLPLMSGRIEGSEAARFSADRSGKESQSTLREERKRKSGSEEIQDNREGQGNETESSRSEVQGRSRKVQGALAEMEQDSSEPSRPEALRGKQEGQGEEGRGSGAVQEIPEGLGSSGKKRSKEASKSSIGGSDANGGRVGRDKRESQTQVLLLQSQDEAVDDGSRFPSEQGGQAHQGKHSSGVSELQQPKRSKDNKTPLVDCPGCDECDPNDGYVLRKGSFRHTRAHEFIFMLTKKMQYWSNQEAVREGLAPESAEYFEKYTPTSHDEYTDNAKNRHPHLGVQSRLGRTGGRGNVTAAMNPAGRNPRSVLDVPTAPYKGAHYATFPPNLIAPLIRATCPRRCCPVCGQGWAAVVETRNVNHRREPAHQPGNSPTKVDSTGWEPTQGNVLGYKPTCTHPHTQEEAVPGICFDPFVGSGTTIAVAKSLLRRGVGIDISMEYLDHQAKVRAGLGTPSNALEDLPLFQ